MNMRWLVTGGAGFIGSHFLHYMTKKYPQDTFLCLDALTYAANMARLDKLEGLSNYSFVKGNICDYESMVRIFKEYSPQVVVNFAAETHVDRSIEDAGIFFHTNVLGTQTLLESCREVKGIHFHQVSTDEVYGDLPLHVNEAFTEDWPLRPSSPYAASKASADLTALAYHRTYDLPVTLSRCSNNYGPWQHEEKLIPKMIWLIREGLPLTVYGDGAHVRDWIHVLDHCKAIDMIVRKGVVGSVYNVGASTELGNLDVVNRLLDLFGVPNHPIEYVKDRPGHDRRYALDWKKIRHELGWRPEISFVEGLEALIHSNGDKEACIGGR